MEVCVNILRSPRLTQTFRVIVSNSALAGQAALSRMVNASAEEKVNETTGKLLRPRGDIMPFKLLASAVISCSVNIHPGGNVGLPEPAKASGLCE